ncbi:hypothetical protein BIV01_03100 [Curtobacterium sp. MCBA15_013]|nr:hypothetical protein BIV01_03100 [Curtobacterium sp. MCBA15_013]
MRTSGRRLTRDPGSPRAGQEARLASATERADRTGLGTHHGAGGYRRGETSRASWPARSDHERTATCAH